MAPYQQGHTSMQRSTNENGVQRVGEIVIVGPAGMAKQPFLQALCPQLHTTNQDILLGALPVNSELILYCYGITKGQGFAWDLVGRNMLGYVVLFDWYDESSFAACGEIVDFMAASFSAPFVVAADIGIRPLPVPESAVRPNIPLSPLSRFLFFQSHKPASVRKVVITLLDVLLEKLD
jgi:hypothetical protein